MAKKNTKMIFGIIVILAAIMLYYNQNSSSGRAGVAASTWSSVQSYCTSFPSWNVCKMGSPESWSVDSACSTPWSTKCTCSAVNSGSCTASTSGGSTCTASYKCTGATVNGVKEVEITRTDCTKYYDYCRSGYTCTTGATSSSYNSLCTTGGSSGCPSSTTYTCTASTGSISVKYSDCTTTSATCATGYCKVGTSSTSIGSVCTQVPTICPGSCKTTSCGTFNGCSPDYSASCMVQSQYCCAGTCSDTTETGVPDVVVTGVSASQEVDGKLKIQGHVWFKKAGSYIIEGGSEKQSTLQSFMPGLGFVTNANYCNPSETWYANEPVSIGTYSTGTNGYVNSDTPVTFYVTPKEGASTTGVYNVHVEVCDKCGTTASPAKCSTPVGTTITLNGLVDCWQCTNGVWSSKKQAFCAGTTYPTSTAQKSSTTCEVATKQCYVCENKQAVLKTITGSSCNPPYYQTQDEVMVLTNCAGGSTSTITCYSCQYPEGSQFSAIASDGHTQVTCSMLGGTQKWYTQSEFSSANCGGSVSQCPSGTTKCADNTCQSSCTAATKLADGAECMSTSEDVGHDATEFNYRCLSNNCVDTGFDVLDSLFPSVGKCQPAANQGTTCASGTTLCSDNTCKASCENNGGQASQSNINQFITCYSCENPEGSTFSKYLSDGSTYVCKSIGGTQHWWSLEEFANVTCDVTSGTNGESGIVQSLSLQFNEWKEASPGARFKTLCTLDSDCAPYTGLDDRNYTVHCKRTSAVESQLTEDITKVCEGSSSAGKYLAIGGGSAGLVSGCVLGASLGGTGGALAAGIGAIPGSIIGCAIGAVAGTTVGATAGSFVGTTIHVNCEKKTVPATVGVCLADAPFNMCQYLSPLNFFGMEDSCQGGGLVAGGIVVLLLLMFTLSKPRPGGVRRR